MSVQAFADQFIDNLLARETAAEQTIIDAYAQSYVKVGQELTKALAAYESAVKTGVGSVQHRQEVVTRLASLEHEIKGQLTALGVQTNQVVNREQLRMVEDAVGLTKGIIKESLGDTGATIAGGLYSFDQHAMQELVGRFADGSPLNAAYFGMAEQTWADIQNELYTGMALGEGTEAISKRVADMWGGSLNRARTLARSAIMDAHRESSRRMMEKNNDVIKTWIWHAACDSVTCVVCWGMHGKSFPLHVKMNTHANCRCTMLAETYSWEELGFPNMSQFDSPPLDTGVETFAELPESEKRSVLGPAKSALYKTGKHELSDFIGEGKHPVYGGYRFERSLKQLGYTPDEVRALVVIGKSNKRRLGTPEQIETRKLETIEKYLDFKIGKSRYAEVAQHVGFDPVPPLRVVDTPFKPYVYDKPKTPDVPDVPTPEGRINLETFKFDKMALEISLSNNGHHLEESLTAEDRRGIAEYKNGHYKDINRYLRTGELPTWEFHQEENRNTFIHEPIAALDRAFAGEHTTLSVDTRVYRGAKFIKDTPAQFKNAKVGDILTDKAYVSATYNKDVAVPFGGGLGADRYMFEIYVPAGSKVIGMDRFANSYTRPEQEVLLPRDTPMLVREVRQENGATVIVMEVMETPTITVTPPEPKPQPKPEPAPKKQRRLTPTEKRLKGLGFDDVEVQKVLKRGMSEAAITRLENARERDSRFIEAGLGEFQDLGYTMPQSLYIGPDVSAQSGSASATFSPVRNNDGHVVDTRFTFNTATTFNTNKPQDTIKPLYDSGHFSSDDDYHIVRHEFAHWLHWDATKTIDESVRDATTRSGFREYTDESKFTKTWQEPSERTTAAKVSKYATENPAEFVAETFAGVMAGNTYDAEVMALYDKYGGPDLSKVQQETTPAVDTTAVDKLIEDIKHAVAQKWTAEDMWLYADTWANMRTMLLESPDMLSSMREALDDLLAANAGREVKEPDKWETNDDAENWMNWQYPHISVDFGGAHFDAIKPSMIQFHKLAQQYPHVARKLKYIGTYNDLSKLPNGVHQGDFSTGAYAHARYNGDLIALNPTHYGDADKLKSALASHYAEDAYGETWLARGVDPEQALASTMSHEFGHLVDGFYTSLGTEVHTVPVVGPNGAGTVSGHFNQWRGRDKTYADTLSRYSTTNDREQFAEAFAWLHHHLPDAQPVGYVQRMQAVLELLGNPDDWYWSGVRYTIDLPRDSPERLDAIQQSIKIEDAFAAIYKGIEQEAEDRKKAKERAARAAEKARKAATGMTKTEQTLRDESLEAMIKADTSIQRGMRGTATVALAEMWHKINNTKRGLSHAAKTQMLNDIESYATSLGIRFNKEN